MKCIIFWKNCSSLELEKTSLKLAKWHCHSLDTYQPPLHRGCSGAPRLQRTLPVISIPQTRTLLLRTQMHWGTAMGHVIGCSSVLLTFTITFWDSALWRVQEAEAGKIWDHLLEVRPEEVQRESQSPVTKLINFILCPRPVLAPNPKGQAKISSTQVQWWRSHLDVRRHHSPVLGAGKIQDSHKVSKHFSVWRWYRITQNPKR